MPTEITPRKQSFETRWLRGAMAAAGCLIIAAALRGNAGSLLLGLATCLACVGRIERNYRRGAYGRITVETIDGAGLEPGVPPRG